MKNTQMIQGILSIAAIFCLVVGWFNLFSPEINALLSQKIFYILIGASFFFQAPFLSNPKMRYPMYLAAAFCIIGALLPDSLNLQFLKTAGLFGGVLLSIFNRPRQVRN
ncbi:MULTISPECIES: hypothetical protein [Chryseobacterium group]|uniref:hypothetical protein n=1 Tax=Chryseobacterium group TaxID=2782232 RepID=UPI0012A835A9|nr:MULTISPECIES: hypothetical protein [Chryseobacterium group]MDF0719350.1 hypothetical protein [Kaistella sp. PBT33-4]QFG52188.1 hypothetical protein F7R58_00910 [Chryseobacterium sp.]